MEIHIYIYVVCVCLYNNNLYNGLVTLSHSVTKAMDLEEPFASGLGAHHWSLLLAIAAQCHSEQYQSGFHYSLLIRILFRHSVKQFCNCQSAISSRQFMESTIAQLYAFTLANFEISYCAPTGSLDHLCQTTHWVLSSGSSSSNHRPT